MSNRISESSTPRYNKSDLQGFLHLLEQHNDLLKINKQVSPKFELAAITQKLDRKQAILFEQVEGSKMSVATNILGTRQRFSLAIGTAKPELIHSHILESMSNTYKKILKMSLHFVIIPQQICMTSPLYCILKKMQAIISRLQ